MMKKIFILAVLFMAIQQQQMFAQTTTCDCKVNAGRNTLVITGSITLTDILYLSKGPKKMSYNLNVDIVNKSACKLVIQNIKVGNMGINPKVIIEPNSSDQHFSKNITATKGATIKDLGDIKMAIVQVTYTLNGKKCMQNFELQYLENVK